MDHATFGSAVGSSLTGGHRTGEPQKKLGDAQDTPGTFQDTPRTRWDPLDTPRSLSDIARTFPVTFPGHFQ